MITQTKKQSNRQTNNNLIEQLKSIGSGVADDVQKDLISGVASDALSSLFGVPKSGEIFPNRPIDLTSNQADKPPEYVSSPKQKQEQTRKPFNIESFNQLRNSDMEVAQKINEIRMELKILIATVKNVNRQLEMAIKEEVIEPGVYHLSFLDRLKTILKLMSKNLNESATWLNCMRSRKTERKYWNQYKKKGTTFGLSSERSTATQTG